MSFCYCIVDTLEYLLDHHNMKVAADKNIKQFLETGFKAPWFFAVEIQLLLIRHRSNPANQECGSDVAPLGSEDIDSECAVAGANGTTIIFIFSMFYHSEYNVLIKERVTYENEE